jgi:hypothetical protein
VLEHFISILLFNCRDRVRFYSGFGVALNLEDSIAIKFNCYLLILRIIFQLSYQGVHHLAEPQALIT